MCAMLCIPHIHKSTLHMCHLLKETQFTLSHELIIHRVILRLKYPLSQLNPTKPNQAQILARILLNVSSCHDTSLLWTTANVQPVL